MKKSAIQLAIEHLTSLGYVIDKVKEIRGIAGKGYWCGKPGHKRFWYSLNELKKLSRYERIASEIGGSLDIRDGGSMYIKYLGLDINQYSFTSEYFPSLLELINQITPLLNNVPMQSQKSYKKAYIDMDQTLPHVNIWLQNQNQDVINYCNNQTEYWANKDAGITLNGYISYERILKLKAMM